MKTCFMTSDTAIKAGDVLFTERPFVYVLSSKEKGSRCDYCMEKLKVHKCSVCRFVYYCGRFCQKKAWKEHKWECPNFVRVAPRVVPDSARLLAKIIDRLNRRDGYSMRAYYTKTSFRMWKDLMSHYPNVKNDKKRLEHFATLYRVLSMFITDMSLPNCVELMGMYGRMVINSFTILDTDLNSIGTGIYLAASIVDHSCDPNAVATFQGKKIILRAIKDMPTWDWNQIRISYIDLMKTPYERQTELLESYYFLCDCVRCIGGSQLGVVHAAKCANPECDSPVVIPWNEDCELVRKPAIKDESEKSNQDGDTSNNGEGTSERKVVDNEVKKEVKEVEKESEKKFECSTCHTPYTEKQVEVFKEVMDFTEMHLQKMKSSSVAYVDVCKFCLDKQEGVLHPLNVMHAHTLDHAFDALILVRMWDAACNHAERLIPCIRYYYGATHPLLGLLHLRYGKILLNIMELDKALEQLKMAEKILKITHGDRHALYTDQLLPLFRQVMLEFESFRM